MSTINGNEAQALGGMEGIIDHDAQNQICGMELTLQKIERFASAGAVAFENKEQALLGTELLDFDSYDWICLAPGAYMVTFN